jgi:hypothetical protein
MAAPLYKRLPAQAIGSALEGLLGGLGSTTEGALGLANTGINFFREDAPDRQNILPDRLPLINTEEVRQHITGPLLGQENLQPGSFPEEVLQAVARNLPVTALTGGSNLPLALAKDVAGSTAQIGAKKLGLPAPLQIFAGIAGEKGFTKTLERAGKSIAPKYLGEMAREAKNSFYNRAEELGGSIKSKAINYKNELEKIAGDVSNNRAISRVDRKEFVANIDSFLADMNKGHLTGKELIDTRTQLNNIISKSKDKDIINAYKAIRKPLVADIKQQQKLHTKWGKALESADDLHAAENFGSVFSDALTDHPKIQKALSNPLAYSLASLGPSFYFSRDPLSSIAAGAASAVGAKGIKKASQAAGFLSKEAPRQVLLEASKNVIDRNIPAALRSYSKLNSMADKYTKQENASDNAMQKIIDQSRVNLVRAD